MKWLNRWREKRRRMTKPARQFARAGYLFFSIYFVLIFGPMFLPISLSTKASSPYLAGYFLLTLVVSFVGGYIMIVMRGRVERRLEESRGRVCSQCMHNLRGLPDTGRCPECGHPFDVAADRKVWNDMGLYYTTKPTLKEIASNEAKCQPDEGGSKNPQ